MNRCGFVVGCLLSDIDVLIPVSFRGADRGRTDGLLNAIQGTATVISYVSLRTATYPCVLQEIEPQRNPSGKV